MFIKNGWYAAAWAKDIGHALEQKWIAGEPVVFYRTQAGEVVALHDRCPHRRAALSKGNLVGDDVQCAYHGITFDCSGKCVSVPGQEKVPAALTVRRYKVVEKWQWVWIWMGKTEEADESLLPAFEYNDSPGWKAVGGCIPVKANYQLLIDNLLDLTHETYVHGKTIGNMAVVETPMEYQMDGQEVVVKRIMKNTPPPPLFKKVRGFTGNIDRWQIIRFQMPSHVSIDARGYPAGVDDIEQGMRWFSMNSLTPLDESNTMYFWTITRCFDLDNEALDEMIKQQIYNTFMEDVEVIEAQQQLIETDDRGVPEVSIRADGGSIAARRIVDKVMTQEA